MSGSPIGDALFRDCAKIFGFIFKLLFRLIKAVINIGSNAARKRKETKSNSKPISETDD